MGKKSVSPANPLPRLNKQSDAKAEHLNVPIELLQLAIKDHCLTDLRALLCLKFNYRDTFPMNKESINELTAILGYGSVKSTNARLNNLKQLGWANYDAKSNLLFIKGFEALRQKLGLKLQTGAILTCNDLISNNQFKGFAAGAVMNNMVKVKLRRVKRQKGGLIEDRINAMNDYSKIANEALAKILKCSIGQAFNLKKLAKSLGYIEVKRGFIDTWFNIKDIEGFKKGNTEISHKLVRKKDKIAIKSSDLVKGNMRLSRREKI
jgi:hypothetical protein